ATTPAPPAPPAPAPPPPAPPPPTTAPPLTTRAPPPRTRAPPPRTSPRPATPRARPARPLPRTPRNKCCQTAEKDLGLMPGPFFMPVRELEPVGAGGEGALPAVGEQEHGGAVEGHGDRAV